jgi:hypothetical protein
VRSTSVISKWQGDQRVGGVAGEEACTIHFCNITSQWQYFVARCLNSYVGNIFGFHSI